MGRIQITDHSGSVYVGITHEQMTKLVGFEADHAKQEWEHWETSEDEEGRRKYIQDRYNHAMGKHVELFTITKKELWNDVETARTECRGNDGMRIKEWSSAETANSYLNTLENLKKTILGSVDITEEDLKYNEI